MKGHLAILGVTVGLFAAACAPVPLDAIELAPTTLDNGLVAHWTFDEGTGQVAVDHSGNKRDAQITGGSWVTDGVFGGALHVEGGDFASADNFPNATATWSVAAWVRLTDATASTASYKTVISTESDGGWEMNIDRSGEVPGAHFGFYKGADLGGYYGSDCSCMTFNQWTHIAATVDPDTLLLTLYVNGTLADTRAITTTISPGSAIVYIGRWTGDGLLLAGDVDDIVIYNRVLVPEEVAALVLVSPPDPH
jgi:hypothetical protein